MRKILLSLPLFGLLLVGQSCKQHAKSHHDDKSILQSMRDSSTIYLYYFYSRERCPTCNAVEEIAKACAERLQQENKAVVFLPINREERASRPLLEKFNIITNALIVCRGDHFNNLTLEAFNHALRNRQRVADHIETEINTILTK